MNESITESASELRHLYWEEGLSLREIGNRAGCCTKTIHNRFDEFGIETRPSTHERPPQFHHHNKPGHAYEMWRTWVDGVYHRVRVHRLVAVAECGFDAVADRVVHHKNGIPWDNRPENLEIHSHSEHASLHAQERLSQTGFPIPGGEESDA